MQSQILKGTISAIFCKKKHHKKIKQSYFKAYNTLYPCFQVNYLQKVTKISSSELSISQYPSIVSTHLQLVPIYSQYPSIVSTHLLENHSIMLLFITKLRIISSRIMFNCSTTRVTRRRSPKSTKMSFSILSMDQYPATRRYQSNIIFHQQATNNQQLNSFLVGSQ